jgi:hypothetical protein
MPRKTMASEHRLFTTRISVQCCNANHTHAPNGQHTQAKTQATRLTSSKKTTRQYVDS